MKPFKLLWIIAFCIPSALYAQNLPLKRIKNPEKPDTSLIVYVEDGLSIHYKNYFPLLWQGDYYIKTADGKSSLKKYPDSILTYIHLYRDRQDSLLRLNNIRHRLSRADKVLVIKSLRKLYILRGEKILFEFPINLGKNPSGHKISAGDGKTPEGNYMLDFKMWNAKYYRNFHISYPNSADIARSTKNKTDPGGDVMIHGTNSQRTGSKDWTNGCIAIANAQMDTLFKYVPIETLIEIRK